MGLNNQPRALINRILDTDGDGTGSTNQAVNGSVTPVTFKLAPAAGEVMLISRIMFYIEDTGNFDAADWGNGITLTNGVQIKQKKNGIVSNFGAACKSTGDLAGMMYDINHFAFGVGNEIVCGRLTFTKFGEPMRLDGDFGDELQIVIQDDLTGLVNQRVTAQGHYSF